MLREYFYGSKAIVEALQSRQNMEYTELFIFTYYYSNL